MHKQVAILSGRSEYGNTLLFICLNCHGVELFQIPIELVYFIERALHVTSFAKIGVLVIIMTTTVAAMGRWSSDSIRLCTSHVYIVRHFETW